MRLADDRVLCRGDGGLDDSRYCECSPGSIASRRARTCRVHRPGRVPRAGRTERRWGSRPCRGTRGGVYDRRRELLWSDRARSLLRCGHPDGFARADRARRPRCIQRDDQPSCNWRYVWMGLRRYPRLDRRIRLLRRLRTRDRGLARARRRYGRHVRGDSADAARRVLLGGRLRLLRGSRDAPTDGASLAGSQLLRRLDPRDSR